MGAPLSDGDWLVAPPPVNRDATILYFTGADLWHKGSSAYGGMTWSPGGLNKDGFTLKMLLAGGDYLYRSSTTDFRGADVVAPILPGYRFKRGNLEIKMFAGLDIQHHWTLPLDPSNKLNGTHAGARFNVDAWWEPLPARMMVGRNIDRLDHRRELRHSRRNGMAHVRTLLVRAGD
jgi:hypothetical protein